MKDLSQVLSQKEMDIERVRKEIKALHFVIPLLAEDADWSRTWASFTFRLAVGRDRNSRRERAATKRTRPGALICLPLAAFCRWETWSLPLLNHIKTPVTSG